MLKLSKIAILSAFLFTYADAGSFSGGPNLFSKGKGNRHSSWSSVKKVSVADSYCYCPAKHGTIGVTHFDFDKSDVTPSAKKLIDHEIKDCVLARLAENQDIKVLITGHADKRGTEEYGTQKIGSSYQHPRNCGFL